MPNRIFEGGARCKLCILTLHVWTRANVRVYARTKGRERGAVDCLVSAGSIDSCSAKNWETDREKIPISDSVRPRGIAWVHSFRWTVISQALIYDVLLTRLVLKSIMNEQYELYVRFVTNHSQALCNIRSNIIFVASNSRTVLNGRCSFQVGELIFWSTQCATRYHHFT